MLDRYLNYVLEESKRVCKSIIEVFAQLAIPHELQAMQKRDGTTRVDLFTNEAGYLFFIGRQPAMKKALPSSWAGLVAVTDHNYYFIFICKKTIDIQPKIERTLSDQFIA